MSYSVHFFAADFGAMRETLTRDADLVQRVLTHIEKMAAPTEDDLVLLEKMLRNGVSGHWPAEDSPDTFTACCWLFDVLCEPIVIGGLRGFRHWNHWEDARLWPYFLQVAPPISVPRSPEPWPAFGFLPASQMTDVLSRENDSEEDWGQDTRAVRTEVLEVIESLNEDRLDLAAIAMES